MRTFSSDYKRYKKELRFVFNEPSIIMVFLYRLRRKIYKYPLVAKFICAIIVEPFYVFLTLLFGIYLPKTCEIGPGLMIYHFGGIILNPKTKIGANCTLRHHVTIGNRKEIDDVPELGNNVNIGCGAVIIGKIKIGNNVDIGANALVLSDVPDNCVAVGNPAIVKPKRM